MLGLERPEHLHCNSLSKELHPLSFFPRTGNFICNYAVPQNCRGYVDPVLPRELDYTQFIRILLFSVGKNLLVYLSSSVTDTPPLGVLFNFKRSLNVSTLSPETPVSANNKASRSRIWIGDRVEVGMS